MPEGLVAVSFIHGFQNASQTSVKTRSPAAGWGNFIAPILQIKDQISQTQNLTRHFTDLKSSL